MWSYHYRNLILFAYLILNITAKWIVYNYLKHYNIFYYTCDRLLLHAYFNRDRNILPLNFRDTSRVANILRERFVNIVLYSYPGTEPNATRQRGKLMCAESRTLTDAPDSYLRWCRIFFFDARRTYGARDRDTNLFVRSQLVARFFIFHVARAIDHCSLRPVISGNW